jgi:hypothetical protein
VAGKPRRYPVVRVSINDMRLAKSTSRVIIFPQLLEGKSREKQSEIARGTKLAKIQTVRPNL